MFLPLKPHHISKERWNRLVIRVFSAVLWSDLEIDVLTGLLWNTASWYLKRALKPLNKIFNTQKCIYKWLKAELTECCPLASRHWWFCEEFANDCKVVSTSQLNMYFLSIVSVLSQISNMFWIFIHLYKIWEFHFFFSGAYIALLLCLPSLMEMWNLVLYSHLIFHLVEVLGTRRILINYCLPHPPIPDLNTYLTFQSCVLCWCMKKLHYTTEKSWLPMHLLFLEINPINKLYKQCICIYILTKIIALENLNHLSIQNPFKQFCIVNTRFRQNHRIQWFGRNTVRFFCIILQYLMSFLAPVNVSQESKIKLNWMGNVQNWTVRILSRVIKRLPFCEVNGN